MIDVGDGSAEPSEIEGLAGRAECDEPTGESFVADRERTVGGSWVEQFAPDLVGDDEEIVALSNVGDRGDFFRDETVIESAMNKPIAAPRFTILPNPG